MSDAIDISIPKEKRKRREILDNLRHWEGHNVARQQLRWMREYQVSR